MNNADWLDEKPTSAFPEDEIIWSELRTCTTGELPNELHKYDLVRIKIGDGYSDDIPAHKVEWSKNPTYQVLHQGVWNSNEGEQPNFVDSETYIQVILDAERERRDNAGQIHEYWWGISCPHSIVYWRVISRQNFLDIMEMH